MQIIQLVASSRVSNFMHLHMGVPFYATRLGIDPCFELFHVRGSYLILDVTTGDPEKGKLRYPTVPRSISLRKYLEDTYRTSTPSLLRTSTAASVVQGGRRIQTCGVRQYTSQP
jgi:hypothetical protein